MQFAEKLYEVTDKSTFVTFIQLCNQKTPHTTRITSPAAVDT